MSSAQYLKVYSEIESFVTRIPITILPTWGGREGKTNNIPTRAHETLSK